MILGVTIALALAISLFGFTIGKRENVAYYSSVIAGGIIGTYVAVASGEPLASLMILAFVLVWALIWTLFVWALFFRDRKIRLSLPRVLLFVSAACVNLIATPNLSVYDTPEDALAVSLTAYFLVVGFILTVYLVPKIMRGVTALWRKYAEARA